MRIQNWIEEKIAFSTSRIVFNLIVVFAFLALTIVVLTLVWSIIPVNKEDVKPIPNPEPVVISLQEIEEKIKPEPEAQKEDESLEEDLTEITQEVVDPIGQEYEDLLDTIKILLPEKLYPWKDKGYYRGSSWYSKGTWTVTTYGIGTYLNYMFEFIPYDDYKEKVRTLKLLIPILQNFPEAERNKPFIAFTELYNLRYSDYRHQISANRDFYYAQLEIAEQEYNNEVSEKITMKKNSLIGILLCFLSIALVAVFLVLLSIHRILNKYISRI